MIESINSPYIHAATTENFKALVLDNSYKGPVIVNFWSKKAGPCLRQYPILDKLIYHYAGKLLLVNIDTENEFIITKEYGIASVPTLKLFRNAQIMETMHGFQSEDDLIKVFDLYVARDSDKSLSKAIQLYSNGKLTEAYETIANAIVSDPTNPRLPLAMCKLLKHEKRYNEALNLITTLPDDIRKHREIVQLNALLFFYTDLDTTTNSQELKKQVDLNSDDCAAKQRLAAHYVIEQQYDQAFQELSNIVELDQGYNDNYAQNAMLRILDILGPDQELGSKIRVCLKRYTH